MHWTPEVRPVLGEACAFLTNELLEAVVYPMRRRCISFIEVWKTSIHVDSKGFIYDTWDGGTTIRQIPKNGVIDRGFPKVRVPQKWLFNQWCDWVGSSGMLRLVFFTLLGRWSVGSFDSRPPKLNMEPEAAMLSKSGISFSRILFWGWTNQPTNHWDDLRETCREHFSSCQAVDMHGHGALWHLCCRWWTKSCKNWYFQSSSGWVCPSTHANVLSGLDRWCY